MRGDTVICGDGVTRRVSDLRGKTHREAYPEQYNHPAVGKLARHKSNGTEGVVCRVVPSPFGPLAQLLNDPNTFWSLSDFSLS